MKCFLMHLYQGTLTLATKDLIGLESTIESRDDHLARLKKRSFHWDPQKVKDTIELFNKFLHG